MADIAKFAKEIQGDVVTEGDLDYPKAIARWAVNAERKAKVVVFVKDENDVSLSLHFAKANNLPIAIRGGGHNPAGASSTEGGLVIDLSRYLNGAKVDPEKQLVYVGGGALWEAVDQEAINHGLATVGGTVNHTGVGGLILGGGYGWLSGSHGLAIDNLVQATIVTADGSVVRASETENPDLFFGIRGGGCNFGVVTEFVLKVHPQRRTVFAGMIIFPPPALEALVKLTQEWWLNAGPKEGMIQVTTVGPDGKPAIILILFYNGSETEGRANFKAFFDLGPVADLAKEIPYEQLNTLQNPLTVHGSGAYMSGTAHKKADYPSILEAHNKAIEAIATGQVRVAILYEYFPGTLINAVPRNLTAFRRDPTASVLILVNWSKDVPDQTDFARSIARNVTDILAKGQTEISQVQTLGYSNYDPDAVAGNKAFEKARIAFGDNYGRLQQLKRKYDPENIFNKWFPIVPAASDST